MAYSKTTELRNTKAKIKELESKVALLESDLELSDTLYKTYKRIQDETEADLNESEKSVDILLAASIENATTVAKLREDLDLYKFMSTIYLVCGLVLVFIVTLHKLFG